ncbi:hypothetical protein [Sphingomonas sp. UYP23]
MAKRSKLGNRGFGGGATGSGLAGSPLLGPDILRTGRTAGWSRHIPTSAAPLAFQNGARSSGIIVIRTFRGVSLEIEARRAGQGIAQEGIGPIGVRAARPCGGRCHQTFEVGAMATGRQGAPTARKARLKPGR